MQCTTLKMEGGRETKQCRSSCSHLASRFAFSSAFQLLLSWFPMAESCTEHLFCKFQLEGKILTSCTKGMPHMIELHVEDYLLEKSTVVLSAFFLACTPFQSWVLINWFASLCWYIPLMIMLSVWPSWDRDSKQANRMMIWTFVTNEGSKQFTWSGFSLPVHVLWGWGVGGGVFLNDAVTLTFVLTCPCTLNKNVRCEFVK